jgi:hypothetical protein
VGEVTDERIDLAEREGHGRVAVEVAPDEAVLGDAQLQRRRAGVLDRGRAVLLDQAEDTQDTADAEFAVAPWIAAQSVPICGPRGWRARAASRWGGVRWAIGGVDFVMAAACLAPMFAQQPSQLSSRSRT